MYTALITREQLARVIAHVEFASKDKTLEVLNAVRITAEGDQLTVTSTDRYILAESTLEATSEDETATASATIPAADITAWKQIAKLVQLFQITLEGDSWTLTAGQSTVSGRTVPAEYPAVSKLFPEDRTLHPITPTGLSVTNLDKLGKFSRAAGIPVPERHWKLGQARPDGKGTSPILALTEGTRVLIMPITNHNDPEASPEGYRHA